MARVIKTVTEAYTVLDGDDGGIIIGNSPSPIAITMPSAVGRATFSITVMNANSGAVTVLGQNIAQNEEILIANSNNTWTYAIGGGSGASAIEELSDVTIISATNGQVLTYNGTTSIWENQDPSGGSALNVLDSELTIALGSFFIGTGTIVVSGTTVTGTGTLFLTEAVVGEMIYGMDEGMIPLGIVSTISSDTVLSLYSAPSDYSGPILIISPGDDSNPQGDPIEGFPILGLATLTKAKEIIDSYDVFTKNAKVNIFVLPRSWSLNFSFMDYNIPISIDAGGAITTGSVSFSNCPDVFIDGLSATQFSFSSVDKVYLERTEATGDIYFGYRFGSVLMAEMYNCTFVDNSCPTGVSAEQSNIYITDVSGNATEYGMKSAHGSNIYKIASPFPSGTTANELTETAGVIR